MTVVGKPSDGTSSTMQTTMYPAGDTTLSKERAMSNAIFRSTTDRFNMSFSAKNPNVRILSRKGGKRQKIVA